MEAGTILKSSWGYDQTNIDFFKVVKVVNGWATVRPIGQKIVERTGWASETVVPNEEVMGAAFRRKVKNYGSEDYVGIHSFSAASVWDGQPEYQSHTH
jgi:hypothetical protein